MGRTEGVALTRRRVRVTRTVVHECGVCGAQHPARAAARRCARSGVEARRFAVGDEVRSRAPRVCAQGGEYRFRGVVKKVIGPVPHDPEVHGKGFGIYETAHLFLYEVAYSCPLCGTAERVRYPARALARVPRRR